MIRLVRFIFATSFMLSGACATDVSFVPELDFTPVDEALEDYLAEHEIEGATMAIVHRDYGILHVRGFGAFEEDRISLIASASKSVTSAVIGRLVDRGLVDWDEPIGTYVEPYWGESTKSEITLAQMLSNSAGLQSLDDNPIYGPYICQFIHKGSLTACARSIYTSTSDEGTRTLPDTKFRYGGAQWQLAGGVAELVSGQSWSELLEETLVRPCRLEVFRYHNHFMRAVIEGGPSESSITTYPSFFDGEPENLGNETRNPNVEGGAYTNVRDYAKILLMHLRGGVCDTGKRALSEQVVTRLHTDHIGPAFNGSTNNRPADDVTNTAELPGYGFGWWMSRREPGYMADGGLFGASPWIDLDRGIGVVVIVEADDTHADRIRRALRAHVNEVFEAYEAGRFDR